jgi:hypothetical protein
MSTELNILILTLTTGEELIANVKKHIERVDGQDVEVCYNLVYPFVMKEQGREGDVEKVFFMPWKKYSGDTQFLLGYNYVMNMCSPLPNVLNSYKDSVNKYIQTLSERVNDL